MRMQVKRTPTAARAPTVFPALLLMLATPAGITAQDVSGDWDVRWAQAVRVSRGGAVEIQAWGDADLTLVQDGEHLTGTWTTQVHETVTWTFRGTVYDGRFSLESTGHDSDNPEFGRGRRRTLGGEVGRWPPGGIRRDALQRHASRAGPAPVQRGAGRRPHFTHARRRLLDRARPSQPTGRQPPHSSAYDQEYE